MHSNPAQPRGTTRLVLASASTARARLLAAAGVPFRAIPAELPEARLRETLRAAGADTAGAAVELARRKALAAAARVEAGELVLGADQILEFEGEWIEKCADMAAAAELLARLRGRRHRLVTAAVLLGGERLRWRHVETVELEMRAFSDRFLAHYLERCGPDILRSVGAYELEGRGAQLFARIEGDFFSVLGLPLLPLLDALRREGVLEE
ncbi:MAG TPA: hypothetical protein ENJ83_05565 [Rhodospirillales bacterium]|nr:hypothetical protein [Rhodospirillales bacterium]